jgi:O-antigen/teichoic acid export membrane protein
MRLDSNEKGDSETQASPHGAFLAKNAALTAGSLVIPLALALLTIPIVMKGYGSERFGIYAIGQVMFGYFGLLDLGIGKAATRFIGIHLADGDRDMARRIARFSTRLAFLFGLAAGVLLLSLASVLVDRVLNVPTALHEEALLALRAVALAVPLGILTSTLQGTLEGAQCFVPGAIIQVLAGVASLLTPVIVLLWTTNIGIAMLALAAVRIIQCGALYAAKRRIYRGHSEPVAKVVPVREIVLFSSWLSITNIVSPLMVSMDRFVIGSLMTLSAVAYYTASYTAMSRLLILPSSVVRALLPEVSRREGNVRVEVWQLASTVGKTVGVAVTLLAIPAVALADILLKAWLGPLMAQQSTLPMQVIAMGVILNSIAYIPFTVLQGVGRTDIPAKAHMAELIVYIPALYLLTRAWGISGAASAWTLRAALDLALLLWAANRMPGAATRLASRRGYAYLLAGAGCAVTIALLASGFTGGLPAKLATVVAVEAIWCFFGYRVVLNGAERSWLISQVRGLFRTRRPRHIESALEGVA